MGRFFKRFFTIVAGLALFIWGAGLVAIFFDMRASGVFKPDDIGLAVFLVILVGGLPALIGLVLLFRRSRPQRVAQPQTPPAPLNPAAQALFDKMQAGLNAAATPKAPDTTVQKTPKTNKKVVDSQNYFE